LRINNKNFELQCDEDNIPKILKKFKWYLSQKREFLNKKTNKRY